MESFDRRAVLTLVLLQSLPTLVVPVSTVCGDSLQDLQAREFLFPGCNLSLALAMGNCSTLLHCWVRRELFTVNNHPVTGIDKSFGLNPAVTSLR